MAVHPKKLSYGREVAGTGTAFPDLLPSGSGLTKRRIFPHHYFNSSRVGTIGWSVATIEIHDEADFLSLDLAVLPRQYLTPTPNT